MRFRHKLKAHMDGNFWKKGLNSENDCFLAVLGAVRRRVNQMFVLYVDYVRVLLFRIPTV